MLWTLLLWTLLLLMDHVLCIPHPVNVSIWSFNLEHILHFLPGPGTPTNALFGVQVLKFRKGKWRDVAQCNEMKPAELCNLSMVFKDPVDTYQARVRAFTSTQSSDWTETVLFHPLSDTILGPPLLTLSGCGNCLLLRVSSPRLKTGQPLSLLGELRVQVQRSRDGARFDLRMPLREEIRVEHLQRGVEYCITVTLHTMFNENSTPSKRLCAESSPPLTGPVAPVSIVAVLFSVLLVSSLGLAAHLFFSSLKGTLASLLT